MEYQLSLELSDAVVSSHICLPTVNPRKGSFSGPRIGTKELKIEVNPSLPSVSSMRQPVSRLPKGIPNVAGFFRPRMIPQTGLEKPAAGNSDHSVCLEIRGKERIAEYRFFDSC